MEILLSIIGIIIENLYFYIGINNIKFITKRKNKIILFLGIIIINLLSSILYLNIYRYIINIFLICLLMKFIYKEDFRIYDIFILPFFMVIKLIIEFLLFTIIINGFNFSYIIYMCVDFILLIVIQVLFKNSFIKIYNYIKQKWNSENKFYVKYITLMIFISLIILIINFILKVRS